MNLSLMTGLPESVVVHPLVLLSVVDHYKRSNLAPGKRVVGILLGNWAGRLVNITNSYALPFEENDKDPSVWYVDHNYHENMSELYKKINAKERPVGWYHSGPKLRPSDQTINDLIRRYCPNPVLCVIDPLFNDVTVSSGSFPIKSYVAVEEVRDDGSTASRTFAHVPSAIEAEEAEAVGVEHLLRDLKDTSAGSLSATIASKVNSLSTLDRQLAELDTYLKDVVDGRLPVNQRILAAVQEMFNLLPDVHSPEAQLSLTVKTNDQMAMIYVGAMARAVISLSELSGNKVEVAKSTNSLY